ncbi:MAG: flagella synthesis protein FlgN [bacterium]
MTAEQESALLQQLGASIDATRQLVSLLQREQKALTEHDVALLEEAVSDKQMLLSRLQLLEEALGATFLELGFEPDKGVLEQMSRLAHDNLPLKTSIEFMRNAIEECTRLSQENALLVNSGIKRVHSSLDLIRGFYEQDVASVYGPPGYLSPQQFKRDIAKV